MDFSSLFVNPKSLLGNDKVWMAFAGDVAIFNNYRPSIQSHLTHSGIPESSQSLWIGLYRIGKSRDEAKTVVVVSCTNHRIRKLTREALRSCPHFEQGGALAQFKIISKATPPETTFEPVPTMQVDDESSGLSNNGTKERLPYNQVPGHSAEGHRFNVCLNRERSAIGNGYLGSWILARQQSENGTSIFQSATAGPLILLDGHSYQLTVQHVAKFDHLNSQGFCHTADDWDDEDNEEAEGGCSSDEDLASWNASTSLPESRTSSLRDINEAVFSDSSSVNSCSQDIKLEGVEDPEYQLRSSHRGSTSIASGPNGLREGYDSTTQGSASRLLSSAVDESSMFGSAEMDYILIPIDIKLEYVSGSAEIIQPCGYFNVYELTEARSVIITTAVLGNVRGAMFPAPTFSRSPRSQSFQTLFCVESEKAMPKGASGSAVFDGETGLLAGYIVLGSPTEGIWYMTPISTVLDDLQERLGVQAICQIQLDISALLGASSGPGSEATGFSTSRNSLRPAILEGSNCVPRPLSHDTIRPDAPPTRHVNEDVLVSRNTDPSDLHLVNLTFDNGLQSTEGVIFNCDLEQNFISYTCLWRLQRIFGRTPDIEPAPPVLRQTITPDGILAPIRYLVSANLSWESSSLPFPSTRLYFILYKGCGAEDYTMPVLGRSWARKCEEDVGGGHQRATSLYRGCQFNGS